MLNRVPERMGDGRNVVGVIESDVLLRVPGIKFGTDAIDLVNLGGPLDRGRCAVEFPPAQPGNSLHVLDHLAGLPQLRFHQLLLRHVHHDAAQPARLAVFSHHRHDVAQPDRAAVAGDEAVLEIVGFQTAGAGGAIGRRPGLVLRMQMCHPESRLEPVRRRKPQQALGFLADEGEVEGAGVGLPDDTVGGVDQITKTLLRGFDHGLVALALGDVAADANHGQGSLGGIAQTRRVGGVPLVVAVLATHPVFQPAVFFAAVQDLVQKREKSGHVLRVNIGRKRLTDAFAEFIPERLLPLR